MVLVQKWPFLQLLFFQAIQVRKKSFAIFWNEKSPFQAIKSRSSKSQKIAIFPKMLANGFGPKMVIFPTSFFFGKIGQENVFYDILERENFFLGYKKTNFKKPKNCHFSKGVNPWFWLKTGHFFLTSFLFFRQNRAGECLLRYSETKKLLCMLEK